MVFVAFMLVLSMTLVVLLKLAAMALSERVSLSREELSPYECGFEHHNVSRIPFSLRYFFLTLLFLLFDLEVVFLLFSPSFIMSNFTYSTLLTVILFVVFLLLTLIYEWADGTLDWLA